MLANQLPRSDRQAGPRLAGFLPLLAILFLPLGVLAGEGPAATTSPAWPLQLPARWLTSNFMEYRGGRYHAGIDLKTREREGFPAFAAEDGWVERVRVTPGGYGRALYLRGTSGRTYVYAHLARFADEVERRIAARQQASGQYRVELEPAPGELPVVQGQAVGLSGQSGTTGPHLHFEVRDAAGRPLDPLATGFAVRDTIAPVIHHVRAVAAGAATLLAGGATSALLPVAGRADGPVAALRASGPVAFTARVVEATDPAGHRLEPWRLELTVDGEVVYRRDNEQFDFADNAQQRLEWLETGGLREQWLHRDPAVTVPGRQGGTWYLGQAGAGLSPGRHRLELLAMDRAGNRSHTSWELEVLEPGTGPGAAGSGWQAQDVHLEVEANLRDPIVLAPLFEVVPEGAEALVRRLDPAAGDPVLAPVTLACMPGPAPDSAQAEQARRQGLLPLGRQVAWAAASWPAVADPVVDLPEGTVPVAAGAGTRLYRWDGNTWLEAGPPLDAATPGGPARFALGRPGTYAALADTAAPTVGDAPLRAHPHPGYGPPVAGLTPPRWEPVIVPVRDDGSGIDAASLQARWDGEPLVVEPDLLRGRVLVPVPDAAGAGPHRLELEATDRAGRRTGATLVVECAGSR